MKKFCVIGDGGWGTALALVLVENGCEVTVWGPFPEYIQQVKASAENKTYLPGVALPANLQWTSDRREAMAGAEGVVIAVPTKYFRPVLEGFKGLIPEKARVLSVAKGLDQQTHQRMTQVAQDVLGFWPVAALSGPSHAEEVGRHIPTAVCMACEVPAHARELQRVFSNARFRVYTSGDVAGVELGGALKNVIAIAVGASDGLGFGDNTRAALITRGLVEMTRLGTALGADAQTFAGLSGLGDLIVTCTSQHSRNRSVGERLGRGETIEHIMGDMKQAAEGVWNCAVARDLAHQHRIEVPIIEEVYAVIHKGKGPREAVAALMTRSVKPEQGSH